MKPSKVFIASSTEGSSITETIQELLNQNLREKIEVRPWTREFELSKTYIETLEEVSDEFDFAIIILTPDDISTSRSEIKQTPRDNVIFELGLFMGSLGRNRCFIVREKRPDLKIPTDLLGIKEASFRLSTKSDLKTALSRPCSQIIEIIKKLGNRYKLSRDALLIQSAIRKFCGKVEGAWWERVITVDFSAISFFQIEQDLLHNSVGLIGKSYDIKGNQVANWKSLIGRVEKDETRIVYHWKGKHVLQKYAHIPFHGFGELEFDKPLNEEEMITSGHGSFWNVNEYRPDKTEIKTTELRRIVNPDVIITMNSGDKKAIRLLIKNTLNEW